MNCEQAREHLIERLYSEELATEISAKLDDHLRNCAACQAEARRLEAGHRALNMLDGEEGPLHLISINDIIQHDRRRTDRSRRRWRSVGVVATAACLLVTVALLFGLRTTWGDNGVVFSWGEENGRSDQAPEKAAAPTKSAYTQATEQQLAQQQEQINNLQAAIASLSEKLESQMGANQELATAVQRHIVALRMQVERSDFRISMLKANMRDLGNVLARFTAVAGPPVAPTSTPGEE
ncbi:MAG: hypothetical protein MPJ50_03725 [Pirellulales bacterium]|nr:hypothetical protein [Pirellulales bacterium]